LKEIFIMTNCPRLVAILLAGALALTAPMVPAADANTEAAPRPSASEVRPAYAAGAKFVDVRSAAEWSNGHLEGALHLPVADVAEQAARVLPDKNQPIITYCAAGGRAETAAESLRHLGYTQVTAMTGGYADLKAANYPVVEAPAD